MFGLRNRRIGAQPQADAALADALAAATAADCLDAAFALACAVDPADILRVARQRTAAPMPFVDADAAMAVAAWLGCCRGDGREVAPLLARFDAQAHLRPDGAMLRFRVDGAQHRVASPSARWLPVLAQLICRDPRARERVLIVPQHAIVAAAGGPGSAVVAGRLAPLHDIPAHALADRVITRPQAAGLTLLIAGAVFAVASQPAVAGVVAVTSITAALLAHAASRAVAIAGPSHGLPSRPIPSAQLPVYSVLVPLFREAEQAEALVQALTRLDYPRDKLDIQFLVEASDRATRHALERAARDLPCRITVVPPGQPQTKPRALNVGLKAVRGSLVTIFDAEDRPDPRQLRLAAETFAASSDRLAVVQARLAIDNHGENWLTRQFALEYACQFDHILPAVSGRGRLVLLGGTSNHFRTSALLHVGGWDPYNVTEDADLAVRLARYGYRIGTVDSDTQEEAPRTVDAWLRQRARWFKGFIQTWLVHNRDPVRLARDLGLADCALMHVFIVGAITAALAHNLFLVQIALSLAGVAPLFGGPSWLMLLQTVIVLLGYGASLTLGLISARRRRQTLPLSTVIGMPLYWVLLGCAIVLAIWDLVRRPHHWRKTTHGLAVRPLRRLYLSR